MRSGLVLVGTGLTKDGEIQAAAEQRSLSEIPACSLRLSLLEMLLITGEGDKYDNCPYSPFPHSQSAVYKVFIEHVSPLKASHGRLGEELQPPLMLLHTQPPSLLSGLELWWQLEPGFSSLPFVPSSEL